MLPDIVLLKCGMDNYYKIHVKQDQYLPTDIKRCAIKKGNLKRIAIFYAQTAITQ